MPSPLAIGLLALGGYVAANTAKASHAYNEANSSYDLIPPPPPAPITIISPGYKEPDYYLEPSLASIVNQSVVKAYPDKVELLFAGCDGMNMSIPEKYGFRTICAPRGKLIAKDQAIREAQNPIIASVDSDSQYPKEWLSMMTKPFQDANVVGTAGTTWWGLSESLGAWPKLAYYNSIMLGRSSAFLKGSYLQTGGFDTSIDQTKVYDVWREEESNFRKKLDKLGKVQLVDAPVLHMALMVPHRGIRPKLDFNSA